MNWGTRNLEWVAFKKKIHMQWHVKIEEQHFTTCAIAFKWSDAEVHGPPEVRGGALKGLVCTPTRAPRTVGGTGGVCVLCRLGRKPIVLGGACCTDTGVAGSEKIWDDPRFVTPPPCLEVLIFKRITCKDWEYNQQIFERPRFTIFISILRCRETALSCNGSKTNHGRWKKTFDELNFHGQVPKPIDCFLLSFSTLVIRDACAISSSPSASNL